MHFIQKNSPRSLRATELTKEFCRQGHNVVVITKYRDHDYKEFLKEYPVTFKMWRKPIFPKIPDFKQNTFSKLGNIISRILSVLFEYPSIEEMFQVKKMLKIENEYDLLISFCYSFPSSMGSCMVKVIKTQNSPAMGS